MTAEIVAASVEVGIAVLREVPVGIARVTNLIRGRRILVLGPARSGKTSFLRYLEFGVLLPEGEEPSSYGWGKRGEKDHRKSKDFIVKTGRDNALRLNVRTAIDVVGQMAPEAHAKFVLKLKPHAIVIMTDCSIKVSGDQSAGRWLRDFAEELGVILRDEARVRRQLRTIIVVLNKADKSTAPALDRRKRRFRGILKRALNGHLNFRISAEPILPCILIENPRDGALADAVIKWLALKLSERSEE